MAEKTRTQDRESEENKNYKNINDENRMKQKRNTEGKKERCLKKSKQVRQ